jgi:hypothetical protein
MHQTAGTSCLSGYELGLLCSLQYGSSPAAREACRCDRIGQWASPPGVIGRNAPEYERRLGGKTDLGAGLARRRCGRVRLIEDLAHVLDPNC